MCRGFAALGKARGKAALRAKARGLPWAKPRGRGEATRARRNSVPRHVTSKPRII